MLRTTLISASLLLLTAGVAEAQGTGARVRVNGMQMYYEVSGAGEPLVVLHGAYMNIPSMGAIIPQLARTHKVYALELQGHGRTTDIDRPITYQNLADDVAAFMDAVGLPKADVFGYSMGAGAGLQLAIRHPAKVNRLVSASGAYDVRGWQPEFTAMIPQMTVEMMVGMPFVADYKKLAPNPNGFPELARMYSLGGAEILVYPTAIGSEPDHPDFDTQPLWQQVIVGNGIANGLFMIAPNRHGSEGTLNFYGSSFISDPYGRILVQAPRDESAVLVADLDLDQRKDWLTLFPFLATRRPETYGRLTEPVNPNAPLGSTAEASPYQAVSA